VILDKLLRADRLRLAGAAAAFTGALNGALTGALGA
jgi:hypothetical protein